MVDTIMVEESENLSTAATVINLTIVLYDYIVIVMIIIMDLLYN